MLSESVTKRALELVSEGMEIMQAIKQAIIDDTNFIGTLLKGSQLSERGQIASCYLFEKYNSKK